LFSRAIRVASSSVTGVSGRVDDLDLGKKDVWLSTDTETAYGSVGCTRAQPAKLINAKLKNITANKYFIMVYSSLY